MTASRGGSDVGISVAGCGAAVGFRVVRRRRRTCFGVGCTRGHMQCGWDVGGVAFEKKDAPASKYDAIRDEFPYG